MRNNCKTRLIFINPTVSTEFNFQLFKKSIFVQRFAGGGIKRNILQHQLALTLPWSLGD